MATAPSGVVTGLLHLALTGVDARFEPAQMIHALEELTDKTYEMVEETDRLAGGEQEENRT